VCSALHQRICFPESKQNELEKGLKRDGKDVQNPFKILQEWFAEASIVLVSGAGSRTSPASIRLQNLNEAPASL